MSDKTPIQQELASNLATMIHAQGNDRALAYLAAFWTTMGREWGGIDRLRYRMPQSQRYLLFHTNGWLCFVFNCSG